MDIAGPVGCRTSWITAERYESPSEVDDAEEVRDRHYSRR